MATAMASNILLQCGICQSHFSRQEHLRRHSKLHDNQRPYGCRGCERSFKRSDALRRHERTCKAIPTNTNSDGNGSTDNDKRPLKRICPTREPRAQDHPDNWTFPLFEDVDSLIDQNMQMPDFPSDISLSLDWLYPASLFESDITLAERLEYLAYFTSARGMATFLDRDTLRGKQNMISEHYKTAISSTNTAIEGGKDHTLLPKTIEIVSNIQSTITTTDTTIIASSIHSWTTETQNAATHFFSPSNIHRFLTFFWAVWYPNCPIVHRPFFDPRTASPALLAVMVIIGACLSPDEEDGRMARKWMDAVEVMTFRQEWFGENKVDVPRIDDDEKKWKSRLECIQTAYLACSLQKREGSVEAQGRVRRHRHAMMVTLARDIGLETANHPRDIPANASVEWWRRFAAEEELIRTLTYVFLFDAALTILHNSPPKMVVSELKMDMACSEACFQAETAEDCLFELLSWNNSVFWQQELSVAAIVRQMCQGKLSEESILEFSQMGTLNLFTTVQSLHSLTFYLQNSLIGSSLTPIQTGLENWRHIWNKRQPEDQYIPQLPETLWKQIGFVRYAPEFWHLARILVARMTEENEYSAVGRKGGRYDHTDMMDVNGLIMEYRRMSLVHN